MNLVFWIAFFAVMAAIFLIIFSQKKEGFASLAEYDNISRERYLELGKNRYNPLADQIDIFRPGVTKGMTESEIKQYNAMANEALKSSELQPMVNMNGLTNTESNLVNSDSALPLENNVLKAANKCEAVKGRDACSILGNPEYKNCGV